MSTVPQNKLRVAMAAWEIGRLRSGLGTKIGGLGAIVEELPPELVKAAARQGIALEVETLSPCFAHYDRSRLTRLDRRLPVIVDGSTIEFEIYEHVFRDTVSFPDGDRPVDFKMVYFWDEWQLNWTNARSIYPSDPWMAAKLYSAVSQAMAAYLRPGNFQTVHLHDYHVGLVPFFLGDDYLRRVPVHLTVHNATYQGLVPLQGGGYSTLDRLYLPGSWVFHRYFDFFNHLNLLKAAMLKVHENGGKITTVSGDIEATWGYAAELRESHAVVYARAYAQKGSPPREVFVPNRHLDLFERLPVAGITNGLRDANRPERLPELNAAALRSMQAARGPDASLFRHPVTQSEMLARDHHFDVDHLEIKYELRRLLSLEAFNTETEDYPIHLTAVGRLVDQKNFGLIADVIEPILAYDQRTKFLILASSPDDDPAGRALENRFTGLSHRYPGSVFFSNSFNQPLSRLILAGGDFTLIPSRFEPCGLVDYEASLLGNVVIGRLTGGLAKVRHCAYLYEWLDIGDYPGELNAFYWKIREAMDVFRHHYGHHTTLMRTAMRINASWDASADQYIQMYRYGRLVTDWKESRRRLVHDFIDSLGPDRPLFARFFMPAQREYSDVYDWELKHAL